MACNVDHFGSHNLPLCLRKNEQKEENRSLRNAFQLNRDFFKGVMTEILLLVYILQQCCFYSIGKILNVTQTFSQVLKNAE